MSPQEVDHMLDFVLLGSVAFLIGYTLGIILGWMLKKSHNTLEHLEKIIDEYEKENQ